MSSSTKTVTLVIQVDKRCDYAGQLHDLDVLGTLVPIVAPTDDDVATACRMAVVAEIPALKFKFDVHALPTFRSDLAHGFAVGKSLLSRFDRVAHIFRQHSKQQHNTLFVHRFMPEPTEVRGIAILRPALQRRML